MPSDKPAVDESTARQAIDDLGTRAAKHVRTHGGMPNSEAIEKFARERVEHVLKQEPAASAKRPDPTATSPDTFAKVRDREDTTVITRGLGSFNWDTTRRQFRAVGNISPRMAQKIAAQRRAKAHPSEVEGDARMQILIRRRLDLFRQYPEWQALVLTAYRLGAAEATHSLANMGIDTRTAESHKIIESRASDMVMEVLEKSNQVFGDWRDPPRGQPLLITAK